MPHANAGVYRTRLSATRITALVDGVIDVGLDVVTNVSAAEAEAELAGVFSLPPRIIVSAFLAERGERRILVDAGSGFLFGPAHGQMAGRLHALGVAPESIGAILVTHAHIDHIGGLVDAEGRAVFGAAEVVLHEAEAGFWLDAAREKAAGEAKRELFATAHRGLDPYRARIRTVRDGEAALPGVFAEPLPGHTPGHCGWRFVDGGEEMAIVGDLVHLPGLQFARPDAGMIYDVDGAAARESRSGLLARAARSRMRVAGAHLDFPPFGAVARRGAGFAFVPEVWRPTAD